MPLNTFEPPRPPSVEAARQETTYRVLRTDFGDGYSQRAADGLNSIQKEWTLEWANLTNEEADEIVNFFEGRLGADAFFWTPPKATVTQTWICTGHSRIEIDAEHSTVTAQLSLVYDLIGSEFE